MSGHNMPLNTVGTLLGATEELRALQRRVRRLRELQTLYLRSAPRELASSSRVKSYRAGTLFVGADNAAVAAKLKQLAPRLLASLHEIEREITKIRIEVQVGGRAPERGYVSQKSPLTPDTTTKLHTLASQVRDPGLKAALERLARRHRGNAESDEHEALEHVQDHHHDHDDEAELKGAPGPGEVAPVAGKQKKRTRNRDHE
jgi:hypothetical protein